MSCGVPETTGTGYPRIDECLQCATYDGYQLVPQMGLLRTPMDNGFYRQRRVWLNTPVQVALSWVLSQGEVAAWWKFIAEYGYSWFELDLPVPAAWGDLDATIATPVRLTGDPSITPLVDQYKRITCPQQAYRVQVSAEIQDMQEVCASYGFALTVYGWPQLKRECAEANIQDLLTNCLPTYMPETPTWPWPP